MCSEWLSDIASLDKDSAMALDKASVSAWLISLLCSLIKDSKSLSISDNCFCISPKLPISVPFISSKLSVSPICSMSLPDIWPISLPLSDPFWLSCCGPSPISPFWLCPSVSLLDSPLPSTSDSSNSFWSSRSFSASCCSLNLEPRPITSYR